MKPTNPDIITPLARPDTDQCMVTSPWFLSDSEFPLCQATYKPLVNGEEAFAAVFNAITNAQYTVDIICWGFQPSMYFVRDGKSPCIGELLCQIAKEKNVQVRILGWEAPFNSAGKAAGEANAPGKGAIRLGDRAGQTATDEQYAYDREWFAKHSFTGTGGDLLRSASGLPGMLMQNIHQQEKLQANIPLFVARGFNIKDRAEIMYQAGLHSIDNISATTVGFLGIAPTHHQKTVLVDFEVPDIAIGFVMGHNMLDEYWDTDKHSAQHRGKDKLPPNQGPRGHLPRQDISSQVTGPVLEYLHKNFANGWARATGEDLMALRNADMVAKRLRPWPDYGTPVMAQLARTQAQEGLRDIEKLYLQTVNNATQFIYIENQYFRWPPLAEAIKAAAKVQFKKGRKTESHGSLYVFVVTNVTDEAIGSGTLNTQRMLDSLGRSDTISGVVKQLQINELQKEMFNSLETNLPVYPESDDAARYAEKYNEFEEKVQKIKDSIIPEGPVPPGLKIHICSLVAKDSPPEAWMPIYVHSKVMIINDVFTTNGSANINTRSMQVDSEMNIAHDWAYVTRPLRRRLWNMHTAGQGVQDDPDKAFKAWEYILGRNEENQSNKLSPIAPLIKFNYTEYNITDKD